LGINLIVPTWLRACDANTVNTLLSRGTPLALVGWCPGRFSLIIGGTPLTYPAVSGAYPLKLAEVPLITEFAVQVITSVKIWKFFGMFNTLTARLRKDDNAQLRLLQYSVCLYRNSSADQPLAVRTYTNQHRAYHWARTMCYRPWLANPLNIWTWHKFSMSSCPCCIRKWQARQLDVTGDDVLNYLTLDNGHTITN